MVWNWSAATAGDASHACGAEAACGSALDVAQNDCWVMAISRMWGVKRLSTPQLFRIDRQGAF